MKTIILCLLILIIPFSLQARDYATLSGETITSEDIESQDKAILFFWTTWCPHCLSQMKTVISEYQDLLDKGFTVYFINVQETTKKVAALKKRLKITSPIIMDKAGFMAYRYRVYGVPAFIFLSSGSELDRTNFISLRILDKIYEE